LCVPSSLEPTGVYRMEGTNFNFCCCFLPIGSNSALPSLLGQKGFASPNIFCPSTAVKPPDALCEPPSLLWRIPTQAQFAQLPCYKWEHPLFLHLLQYLFFPSTSKARKHRLQLRSAQRDCGTAPSRVGVSRFPKWIIWWRRDTSGASGRLPLQLLRAVFWKHGTTFCTTTQSVCCTTSCARWNQTKARRRFWKPF